MPSAPAQPTLHSVLHALSRERLYDLGRVLGAGLRETRASKAEVAQSLSATLSARRLPEVLRELGRDELKAVCRAHGLNGDDPQRSALIERVSIAAGLDPADSIVPPSLSYDGLPQAGQVLSARGRQWLVEAVSPGEQGGEQGQSPLLRLACLDDDAPGKRLDLLWDLEIGARVIDPKNQGLDAQGRLDPPAHFGAYLHALKWSAASAADATRLQAPFRAGIKLMPHQLVPLIKALELPRANLFIADDVGLGKTIEAGLVLQELILRQQAEFVLVVCPASVCLQWRDEMMRRFGLRFEVMSRSFLALRRRERGFGVNPWATHHRFIVSTPLIRRPEYRDPLLAHLGQRAEKGLLILDEAHVAAPASASKYAVDSDTTRAIRDLAPKFDNRLFLSATPHNGHSNSFSALLEILDPIRFTRGSKVNDPARLEPVMVRRLKRDLRQLGVASFPERILCQLSLHHDPNNGGWSATQTRTSADAQRQEASQLLSDPLGGQPDELELAELLARYTELCAPEKGKGRLVFVNLQKRLLSSPEAFARSIEFHAAGLAKKGGVKARANEALGESLGADTKQDAKQEAKQFAFAALDPEAYGDDDDVTAAEELALVAEASAALPTPTEEAKALLSKMRAIAERARRRPDAKVLSLFSWLQKHCCPALGRPDAAKAERAWTERRVILFTEYADTKRYLDELLQEAVRHTEGGGERLLRFHGGMGDEQRDEVQRAFNTSPKEHPVRILIGTDAAREGVNLQAHCADLFHVDVPWNPSRLEQRNGRIDRTLQPASEVRCHYFFYTQRREDRVLDTLVRKIQTVQAELGSMGAVLMDEMERALEPGIQHDTQHKLENIGNDARGQTVAAELEALRQQETTERQQETTQQKQRDRLQAENLRAGQLLERSKRALQVDPDSLRGVVEIGLCLAGAESLIPGKPTEHGRATYTLPKLDASWEVTLDSLRPPKSRVQSFWEWRATPPRPVTFEPLSSLSEEAEQLHLAHPLVKRILDRFAAQGFGAHDLCRVCAVTVPGESVARVIAYARLTLFGHGAARLHDELVAIAAAWIPGQTPTPYKDPATAERAREATERALAAAGTPPTEHVQHQVKEHASALFATLWPHLEAEADARSIEAKNGLARRARKESEDLTKLLLRQQKAVDDDLGELKQTTLAQITDKLQRRQVELDIQHLETRATQFTQQLKQEPQKIAALYAVEMTRLSPVGLVFAWPGDFQ